MPLQLYNSLTRRKEPFVPIDPQNVRMYVCGPTVYDLAHIGNARAVVVFDVLYRLLRHEYGAEHVKYVRNITDIDDKIIDAARANGEPIAALTERTMATFHADMAALGNFAPDVEPRCTAHVPQMIAMIERLIALGHAYAAEGHVLFSVASWPGYGRLSRRSRQEMVAGARVEVAPYKRDPGDFVLWKPSTPDQPGWDSPWGRGRPGWHIECSAMSEAHLGAHFDIHGGGLDLIFPHHENELAQSEAAHGGEKFVNFWLHNGFLSVDSTKMSKSLGNFVTAHELLKSDVDPDLRGEAIRFALLMTHYRDPLNWTDDRLSQATNIIRGFYLQRDSNVSSGELERRKKSEISPPDDVVDALKDDLNTPLAIARLHAYVGDISRASTGEERTRAQLALAGGARILGLLKGSRLDLRYRPTDPNLTENFISDRIAERLLARKERRFSTADKIRSELADLGVILEDRPDGTTDWRRA